MGPIFKRRWPSAPARLDSAVADYSRVIDLRPRSANAYNNRGIVYRHLGDFEKALADYDTALRLDPRHEAAYDNRGTARLHLRDYDRAVADHTAALKLEGPNAASLNNRGNAYRNRGDYGKAIADFNAAVEIDAEDPLPYYNRGLTHRLLGDYARAIADFARAAFLDPTDADAPNELAWVWATCPDGHYRHAANALDYAQHACELTGWQDASCLDTLAAAYAVGGKFDDAADWQSRAVELASPGDECEFRDRLDLYRAGRAFRDRAA